MIKNIFEYIKSIRKLKQQRINTNYCTYTTQILHCNNWKLRCTPKIYVLIHIEIIVKAQMWNNFLSLLLIVILDSFQLLLHGKYKRCNSFREISVYKCVYQMINYVFATRISWFLQYDALSDFLYKCIPFLGQVISITQNFFLHEICW